MPVVPVLLVLLSAVGHVFWNFQLKRSASPALFSWWLQALGSLLALPVGLALAWPVHIPLLGWACVAGTGAMYATYYSFMARSYRSEDLSRAYPIARGVAPAVSAGIGVALFHEMPTLAGWLGIAAISAGVLALAWPRKGAAGLPTSGVVAAICTGLCTCAYSAIDKVGVHQVHPALYIALTYGSGALFQSLWLMRGDGAHALMVEVRRAGWSLWGAAAVSVGGYLIILFTLRAWPLSYVIPLRSVSVLFSVLVGSHFLSEEAGAGRYVAAILIVLGIAAISFAH